MPAYEAKFEVLMPGMQKANFYQIMVKEAANPVEALQKALEEWARVTEPRDVRIREIAKVQ